MTQNFLPNFEDSGSSILRQPTIHTPTNREPLRHLLIGSPRGVRSTIHTLHSLGFAEAGAWSPLLPTANPGEVMSILTRYLLSE